MDGCIGEHAERVAYGADLDGPLSELPDGLWLFGWTGLVVERACPVG